MSDVHLSSDPTIFNLQQMSSLPVTSVQLSAATRRDSILSKVYTYTLQGWPTAANVIDSDVKHFFYKERGVDD